MTRRISVPLALVALAVATVALSGQNPTTPAAAQPAAPAAGAQPAAADADREAIRKAARAFADAFNKGDARAVAAMWTENGESREADGTTHVGRPAIEKAHADFFKANPGAKVELLVQSIRFPAKDLAIEEGLVRQSRGIKQMPVSSSYVAIHIREAGQWKVALSSEALAGGDRLEDLDWVLGTWTTKTKVGDVKLSFAKDAKKPLIHGTFTRTPTGKEPVAGTIRVAFDPELRRLRSWGFEDDGAHSQAVWHNDGKSWLIEIRGVLADGTAFSETVVLQRVAADAITWHTIDRLLDGRPLPDTTPMRLTRAK